MADPPPLTTHTTTLRTLDHTRHRLLQLTNALSSLRRDLEISDPLPPPHTLQKTSQLLTHHLSTLSTFLSDPSTLDTLSRTVVYPVPSAGGGGGGVGGFSWAHPDKEGILTQLVRKKLDPGVEGWVDEGRGAGLVDGGEGALGTGDLEELWKWAKPRAGELAAGVPWGIDYSLEERERGVDGVVTGIRRALDGGEESDDDDDEDEDSEDEGEGGGVGGKKRGGADEMEGVQKTGAMEGREKTIKVVEKPMVPLEELLRFAGTGAPFRGPGFGGGVGMLGRGGGGGSGGGGAGVLPR